MRDRTRATSVLGRVTATCATLALAAGGAILVAAPASAGAGGGEVPCPTATRPPSTNTWFDKAGEYRGTRLLSSTAGPRGGITVWRENVYETFGDDFYQRESWTINRTGEPERTDCQRQEHPKPEPRGGGGSGSGYHSYGGGVHMIATTTWVKWKVSVGSEQ
ncbi:hypothetical protein GCG21_02015 [Pseudactinotalea sp. HY160]|uniref:hypothetical protein n=1 Tax=Pseudactinotalea sp. HY160 TaxID=2654490 RepID=UPI00128D0803|nr:hypothetical protein [Pseudactinotalea sp. HY160]MPV48807.1 hypothetical protein [Pseudactinotalea sp. HY160]